MNHHGVELGFLAVIVAVLLQPGDRAQACTLLPGSFAVAPGSTDVVPKNAAFFVATDPYYDRHLDVVPHDALGAPLDVFHSYAEGVWRHGLVVYAMDASTSTVWTGERAHAIPPRSEVVDTEPPSTPQPPGLAVYDHGEDEDCGGRFVIRGELPADFDGRAFVVLLDGVAEYASLVESDRKYVVTTSRPGPACLALVAIDEAGNESAPSAPTCVELDEGGCSCCSSGKAQAPRGAAFLSIGFALLAARRRGARRRRSDSTPRSPRASSARTARSSTSPPPVPPR